MSDISFTQSRTVVWNCALCRAKCSLAEKDYTNSKLTYACTCGRTYTVTFGQQVKLEENRALDSIFQIDRYTGGIEVRLQWNHDKGKFASVGEDNDWSEALNTAIGYCWRVYGEEIIARIKAMPEQAQEAP
jgi:hypothetical protein